MTFKEYVEKPVKYCFIDYDGTIRNMGKEGHAPSVIEDVQAFPWSQQRIQEALDKGYKVVGITNQSYITQHFGADVAQKMIDETQRQIGIKFPTYFAKSRAESKPGTFMPEQAFKDFGPLDKENSVFVGDDLAKDGGCAKNLGIRHITEKEFKENGVP
jgi:HAD superfamily hydrolase (TIGR01662 family)